MAELQPHQQRVVAELNELQERLHKLRAFIGSDKFVGLDEVDRELLIIQENLMDAACELIEQCLDKSPLHDDYKPLDHEPDKIERCPMCGSCAKLWQYSESETAPRQLVVMCEHGEPIGPQNGIRNEGCLLYMPPEGFYQARITDAVRYWNEFAKALSTLRRGNNWKHAQPLRDGNAGVGLPDGTKHG